MQARLCMLVLQHNTDHPRGARSASQHRSRRMHSEPSRDALGLFIDILLPGDANWPPATQALKSPTDLLSHLASSDRDWLLAAASRTGATTPTGRINAMQGLEREDGPVFARILRALYELYYASDPVQLAVSRLIDGRPQDTAVFFDQDLLMQVQARQAGRRRL